MFIYHFSNFYSFLIKTSLFILFLIIILGGRICAEDSIPLDSPRVIVDNVHEKNIGKEIIPLDSLRKTGQVVKGRHTIDKEADASSEFWVDLITSLIGTLLGAGLAIPVGLYLDRWIKERETKEQISSILSSIKVELDTNLGILESHLHNKETKGPFDVPRVQIKAWEAAQYQGFLTSNNAYQLIKKMIGVYDQLELIRRLNEYMWSFLLGPEQNYGLTDKKIEAISSSIKNEAQPAIYMIKECIQDINDIINLN